MNFCRHFLSFFLRSDLYCSNTHLKDFFFNRFSWQMSKTPLFCRWHWLFITFVLYIHFFCSCIFVDFFVLGFTFPSIGLIFLQGWFLCFCTRANHLVHFDTVLWKSVCFWLLEHSLHGCKVGCQGLVIVSHLKVWSPRCCMLENRFKVLREITYFPLLALGHV